MDLPKCLWQTLYSKLQHPIHRSITESSGPQGTSIFTSPKDKTKPSKRTPPAKSSACRHREATNQDPFPLLLLPLDLLHYLSTFLPPCAQISLRLTSRALLLSLPPPTPEFLAEMDECGRRAVRFHFEESLEGPRHKPPILGLQKVDEKEEGKREWKLNHGSETMPVQKKQDRTQVPVSTSRKGRMRCALCKALYPLSLFDTAGFLSLDVPCTSPSTVANNTAVTNVSDPSCASRSRQLLLAQGHLNPRNRVCKWHDPHFHRTFKRGTFSKAIAPNLESETMKEGWALREACMHCGCVYSWDGDCECRCQSCGSRAVWTFARVLEEEEGRVEGDVWLRWIF